MLNACAAATLAECAVTVCVIHKEAEVVFLFECSDFFQDALVTAHAKYTFGHYEDTTAFLICVFFRALEILLDAFDVIMLI